jgi:hypothetical protein
MSIIATLRMLDKQSRPSEPPGPSKVSAIIRCYRVALGEIDAAPPLDPHSPAAAIVRAYRKACGEVVEEPDEPNRLAAPPVKITAVAPVAECQEGAEHDE